MKSIIKTAIATSIVATSTSALASTAAAGNEGAFFVGVAIVILLWLAYRWVKGTITMGKENGFILVAFYWVLLSPIQVVHAIWIGTRPVIVKPEAKPFTQNITINNVISEPRTVETEVIEGYTEGASGITARTPK